MLSANDDTKLVMKGISHGACDYLLKPVRLEELKNIWQHVIRRKKFDSQDRNGSNSRDKNSNDENGNRGANSDQNAKLSRKRKDQNMDDDEDQDENEHENEDPSSQKKPRVVWSVELHRKFVAAVNQLGLDSMCLPILLFYEVVMILLWPFESDFIMLICISTSFRLNKLLLRESKFLNWGYKKTRFKFESFICMSFSSQGSYWRQPPCLF